MSILFSAGEVSADIVSALIAKELRRREPSTEMWGLGGPRMREAGIAVDTLTTHLGRIGVSESFSAILPLFRAFNAICRKAHRERPDVAILVANDVFNVILGRWLRSRGIPTLAVFPPQVWIWRAFRRFFSGSWDVVAASFQEEQRLYAPCVRTVFTGHHLADQLGRATDAERTAAREALQLRGRVIGLFPGSRIHELRTLTPILLDSAAILLRSDASVGFVMPLAETADEAVVQREIETRGLTQHVRILRDSHEAIRASDLLLLASGTATLEASIIGTPMIVLYRVQPLTLAIVRTAIRLGIIDSETIALPNLILGETVVPEIRQEQLEAGRVASEALALLGHPERMAAMRENLSRVRAAVAGEGTVQRIADLVEELRTRPALATRDLSAVALEGGSV